MENFAVAKNSNFKDIENAFRILEINKNLRLRLPNNLQEQGVFGIEGLVFQLDLLIGVAIGKIKLSKEGLRLLVSTLTGMLSEFAEYREILLYIQDRFLSGSNSTAESSKTI